MEPTSLLGYDRDTMVTRETGEYGSDGSALPSVDPNEPTQARQMRPRRITDLEGPLHRRQIGTEEDETFVALDLSTGPWGARGQVEALIDEAPVDNDGGLEAVVSRLANWVAGETRTETGEVRSRMQLRGASFKPAYRVEVQWRAGDDELPGPSDLVVHPDVPDEVQSGDLLPGSDRPLTAEVEEFGERPTVPGLDTQPDGEAVGHDTHPDLPRVTAVGVQTGPAALDETLEVIGADPTALPDQPGELLFEVPVEDEALDHLVTALAHASLRDAVIDLSEQARSGELDEDDGRKAWISVSAIPVTQVEYDFDGEPFQLWVYGFGEHLWADQQPLSAGLISIQQEEQSPPDEEIDGITLNPNDETVPVSLPIRRRGPSAPSVVLSSGLQEAVKSQRRDRATARDLPQVTQTSTWAENPDTEVTRLPSAPPRARQRSSRGSMTFIWLAMGAVLAISVCVVAGFLAWRAVNAQAESERSASVVAERQLVKARQATSPTTTAGAAKPASTAESESDLAPASADPAAKALVAGTPPADELADDPADEAADEPADDTAIDPHAAIEAAPTAAPGGADEPSPVKPEAVPPPEVALEDDGATHEVYGTAADEDAPWLSLRSRRHRKSRLVARMPDNTRVKLLRRGRTWWKVKVVGGTYDRRTGWAHRKWLRGTR